MPKRAAIEIRAALAAKGANTSAQRNRERLTDSIVGSLRVEGYLVKRTDVLAAVKERQASRTKK